MKKVLILGSGMIARPLIEYLMSHGYRIIVASPMKGRADELIAGNPLGASIDWSMDDPETLHLMIEESDITVSLLPHIYHAEIAKICLSHRKPLVNTSNIQKEMYELDEEAKQAGIILLSEVGFDPGFDHMSAKKVIDMIHQNGGRVLEYFSLCGALPAPEAADNPPGYKFTFSPKGVILATLNDAAYIRNNKVVTVPSEEVFRNYFIYNFRELGEMEVFPGYDSQNYASIYGIPEVITLYRGNIRYRGFCESIDALKRLNLLDNTLRDYSGKSYADFLAECAGLSGGDLFLKVKKFLGTDEKSVAIKTLQHLGLFSDEKLQYFETTPFHITSDRMIEKMMIKPGERDMIVLKHIFLAEWANGNKEVIKSFITNYGSAPANTAISRTAALPAAVAVKLNPGSTL